MSSSADSGWKLEHKIAAAGVGGLAAMGLFKLLDHTFLISQDVKVLNAHNCRLLSSCLILPRVF
jgi:hypothetical protein